MGNDRFKYRVWDNENKRYWDFITGAAWFLGQDGLVYDYGEMELEPGQATVEQCTGFRDKRDKLIYENDVVLCYGKLRCVVKWELGGWFVCGGGILQPLCDAYASAEVVGIVHDEQAKGGELCP